MSGFPLPGEPDPPKAPLKLLKCDKCQLVQLAHTVEPDELYRTFFWYKSSTTETMKAALRDVVDGARVRTSLRGGDVVIDIGSNDSELLTNWDWNLECIGFEPARNLMEEARRPDLTIVNDYFSHKALTGVTGRRAQVITAVAMFYDLHDIPAFLEDVRKALALNGTFVIQQAYLVDMLRNTDISNIVHEHLSYQSLYSLEQMLQPHGLKVFDVERNNVNGGSFRTYICHKGSGSTTHSPTDALLQMRFEEHAMGLDMDVPYRKFAEGANERKQQFFDFVGTEQKKGGVVYGYGASTKANTLLQAWNVDRMHLPGIAERDPRKVGRETAGQRIPIMAESVGRTTASAFAVFPFFFRSEMIERERPFLERGGKMFFPLPFGEVISAP